MGCGPSSQPPTVGMGNDMPSDHDPISHLYGLRDPCRKKILEWAPDKEKPKEGTEENEEKKDEEKPLDLDYTEEESAPPKPPEPIILTEEDIDNMEIKYRLESPEEEVASTGKEEDIIAKTDKVLGRTMTKFDFRDEKIEPPTSTPPVVAEGELWEDEDFSLSVALDGLNRGEYQPEYMAYRRPKELASDPVLYSGKPSRLDIEQGSVGTCYYLSVLQSIIEHPSIMEQIIPEGSYKLGRPDYDGVFHCRFWRFGRWQDVYIDDRIPSYPNRFWGAHNKDKNHMLVALLEKAFAKFHGSYKACWSGHTGYSFMALTGGTYERLDQEEMKSSKNFCERIKTSLSNGSVVACSVPRRNDGVNGLIGAHAYSVTALYKIPVRSRMISLIRIRNPWGKAKGEWTGAWSDEAVEWRGVAEDVKKKLEVKSDGDGEFWMTVKDYFKNFTATTVCNLIPDADQDGQTDGLAQEQMIRGAWSDPELGEFSTRLYGQKFIFEIPGKEGDEGLPVVIQLLQEVAERKETNSYLTIRADLFKVEMNINDEDDGECFLLRELTNDTVFSVSELAIYRYPKLCPGKYMVVPYYIRSRGEQREFMVRIFTSMPIDIRSSNKRRCFMDTLNDGSWQDPNKRQSLILPVCKNLYGKWVVGKNAGGQIGYHSHDINPQYHFTISGKKQAIKFTLVQEDAGAVPIGFMLMEHDNSPMSYEWIVRNKRAHCVRDVKGGEITFIQGGEASASYHLNPGKYMLIIFTDQPDTPRSYFLQINSRKTLPIKEYNCYK